MSRESTRTSRNPLGLAIRGLVTVAIVTVLGSVSGMSPAGPSQAATVTQPSGQGVVRPQRVSTSTIRQVHIRSGTSAAAPVEAAANGTTSGRTAASAVKVAAPTTNFSPAYAGEHDSGYVPDPNGAGGADNYLEITNQGFSIYSRGGVPQYSTTFNSWFGSSTCNVSNYFDPNVVYDQFGKVFIFEATSGQCLFLSVAQQTSATSTDFCNYSFPSPNGDGFDFTKLGVNGSGIYLSSNLGSSTKHPTNALYFVNRTTVESCGTLSYKYWTGLTNPNGSWAEAVTPAVESSQGGAEYLVNSLQDGGCQLTLWTLTATTLQLSKTSVATQCYSPPPKAPQEGSSALIGGGDCSISHASYVNGLLTVDVTSSYNFGDGNGSVGAVAWFVLNPSTNSISSQGTFGTPGYWLLYPAVVQTPSGKLVFVYGASSRKIYPSLWTTQYVSGSFTTPKILASGVAPYSVVGTSPFADYQSAWLDDQSTDPNGVWLTGAYAGSGGSAWGTEFTLVPAT